eukprot:4064084-Alexandrium_andersonii.AAC.1
MPRCPSSPVFTAALEASHARALPSTSRTRNARPLSWWKTACGSEARYHHCQDASTIARFRTQSQRGRNARNAIARSGNH